MTPRDLLRIAAGILIGLAIASLPFLQYGLRSHDHHRGAHHHHATEGEHR